MLLLKSKKNREDVAQWKNYSRCLTNYQRHCKQKETMLKMEAIQQSPKTPLKLWISPKRNYQKEIRCYRCCCCNSCYRYCNSFNPIQV